MYRATMAKWHLGHLVQRLDNGDGAAESASALKAASDRLAGDMFLGDDFHHNGASG